MDRYAIHNLVLIRKGYILLVKNRRQAIISGKTSLCGQFPSIGCPDGRTLLNPLYALKSAGKRRALGKLRTENLSLNCGIQ